jgi:hypothetical protein
VIRTRTDELVILDAIRRDVAELGVPMPVHHRTVGNDRPADPCSYRHVAHGCLAETRPSYRFGRGRGTDVRIDHDGCTERFAERPEDIDA